MTDRHPWAISVASLLVALGLSSGCDRSSSAQSAPAPVRSVQITHVTRGKIARTITLPANVRAFQEATLYAKVSGYLKSIRVDRGDAVAAGALLGEIEVPELLADRTRCQAEVGIAEAEYGRVCEAREKAPDLVVPQMADAATAKLDMATANLQRIETLLDFAKLTAPFSGIITKRWVDPGALVPAATSGSAAKNAAIVSLADFSKVRVEVAIPESEVRFIKSGLPVEITARELPGYAFDGRVTRFAYALDEGTKTMPTEIEVPNAEASLRPGMYVTVKIHLEERDDVLLIPSEAVVTEKDRLYVFTVTDSVARKTPVSIGFDDGIQVEIVDGLDAALPIVLAGKQTVSDGQRVRPVESR